MVLSGNFGEIRSDHFHSGIDIKTQGTIGHHVFSIDNGYVSRIKVQGNGYGKSIYVAHPNGYTSVYGHLNKYREDIADYVREIQYKRRSHAVDIYLKPGKFNLKKGEFLAYSGNSGGSSGPHLHFEIRTTGDQHPTNVLKYGFAIKDHVAPRFHSLYVYPIDNSGNVNGSGEIFMSNLVPEKGYYTIPYGTTIKGMGKIGIGVEVFDYLDGASNRCGVHSLKLILDEKMIYEHVMDEFSFSETRYVNAHILYSERIRTGKKIHRLHRLSNDKLRIYHHLENGGLLELNEPRDYEIRVLATDVAGHQSELKFRIRGGNGSLATPYSEVNSTVLMSCSNQNKFENSDIRVTIPAGALYEDLNFRYEESSSLPGSLSKFYHLHTSETPVHKPFTLSIKADNINESLRSKLLMVTVNGENAENIVAAGGEYSDGAVVASLRSFGKYAIGVDTIAPEITPVNGSITGNLSGRKSLKFSIKDDLSGIDKYEGYIDNNWVLFEYDPKNDLLTYVFDNERISSGKQHELELYISDLKGNVNLYHTTFTW